MIRVHKKIEKQTQLAELKGISDNEHYQVVALKSFLLICGCQTLTLLQFYFSVNVTQTQQL